MNASRAAAAIEPQPRVELVEVGPRDGLQNESRALDVATRVELIARLVGAGVRRLEAVSFVRPDLVPQMAHAEEVMAAVPDRAPDGDPVTFIGLVLNRRGAERAVQTSCHELNMVVPVTDSFALRNQGAPTARLLDQAADVVDVAHTAGRSVSVTLPVSFGCPFEGPVTTDQVATVVAAVLALGVDEIAIADTIGVGVPRQVAALAGLVPDDGPRLRFHFHNTRNTGYANAWTAATLERPASAVALDASVGGFGGCPFAPAATGNIATEDLLYLLGRSGVPMSGPRVDVAALTGVAEWLGEQLGSAVPALLGRAGGFGGVG